MPEPTLLNVKRYLSHCYCAPLSEDTTRWFCDRGKQPRADLHHDPRAVSFFRLDFADPHHMRPGMAGKPVYLGLMMDADRNVKIKPQNLPLRALA